MCYSAGSGKPAKLVFLRRHAQDSPIRQLGAALDFGPSCVDLQVQVGRNVWLLSRYCMEEHY